MPSGLEQKLLQRLARARDDNVMHGLDPPKEEDDKVFEFGRRIGYRQGMDYLIKHVIAFYSESEQDDETL